MPTQSPSEEPAKNPAAVSLGRLGGLKGGKARAKSLTPERRREIAMLGVKARLKKLKKRKAAEANNPAK
jgi:hypothetical protein